MDPETLWIRSSWSNLLAILSGRSREICEVSRCDRSFRQWKISQISRDTSWVVDRRSNNLSKKKWSGFPCFSLPGSWRGKSCIISLSVKQPDIVIEPEFRVGTYIEISKNQSANLPVPWTDQPIALAELDNRKSVYSICFQGCLKDFVSRAEKGPWQIVSLVMQTRCWSECESLYDGSERPEIQMRAIDQKKSE
jgi:hypothetical protein